MAYVAHFNTSIPGYELKYFYARARRYLYLSEVRTSHNIIGLVQAYASSLTTFTTQSIVLATITYSNDDKSGPVLA